MLYRQDFGQCFSGKIPYKIRHDDNIYKISKRFNISIQDIAAANPKININLLHHGSILFLPINRSTSNYKIIRNYITKPGDNLDIIAKNFNLSIIELAKANPYLKINTLKAGQNIIIPFSFNKYISKHYKITFDYPSYWKKISDTRYEGIDGFFQISAFKSQNHFDEICKKEATNILRPYGQTPTIKFVKISKQSSCFILPSMDQPESMNQQSAFIIKYPEEIKIYHTKCNYLILLGDRKNIQGIAGSIKFLRH